MSDASDLVQVCCLQFKHYGRRSQFSGAIRTIKCPSTFPIIRDVLSRPGEGCILVIDAGGDLNAAVFGETMARNAVANGWGGIVVNGAIRDSREIGAMDIGVLALGVVARRGSATAVGEIDIPVDFGGVSFRPGCILVADDDGVVVLPDDRLLATSSPRQ